MLTVPAALPRRTAVPVHEPRRDDCPWCGSRRLRTLLRSPDLTGRGPGTFVVDACRDCAHVFQNPRLTPEGLATFRLDRPRAGARRRHRATARALRRILPEPESWLDVGTGHGHFPERARELLPYTAFDGVDPTDRAAEALAAERVEEAYRGPLTAPEITTRLRARYDVVSMLHHLPGTHDPRAELRAALTVLRPGGLLFLELPDPDSAFAALLGRRWLPYDQPRHLHLIPLPNLRAELEHLGCTILVADRAAAHIPDDLTAALTSSLMPLYRRHRALRRTTAPLLAATILLDHALAPVLRRTHFSNAYRVIARKPGRS
ncbi:class I SAM-dependent methyltransferase [Streptomyces sp. TRM68367]|uniref:class I SAM-dependent methyltransferase n=1 Tax=Streptomyces sp. TRM68367 TaxID=2758415 RepID=UPI00165C2FAB|nr:class I SAM-dependent methyltransferase [Streptomyces sp. TRM68367]MBC9728655.1 class I SAM-dependent methyltransferase [Streptomyces sp. TRM68367]